MSTLLSAGHWARDPRSPLFPTLFHNYVIRCLSLPSKTKVRGRFPHETLISWATATSFAISCSVSSWVRKSYSVEVLFWGGGGQSFKQSIVMSFKTKKENRKWGWEVQQLSAMGSALQPLGGGEPKGLWALGFVHLAHVLTLASNAGWEKLPDQLGCWMLLFTCTPVLPAPLFQHPWESPSDHVGRPGAANWCLQLPRVNLHGVWVSNLQHSKWWHLGI